jgi:hypothetical protein
MLSLLLSNPYAAYRRMVGYLWRACFSKRADKRSAYSTCSEREGLKTENLYYRFTAPVSKYLFCLFYIAYFMLCISVIQLLLHIFAIKFNTKHNPMRWITWLASRWRAQQSAWTNVICRTHWSSISWTHIAVTVRFRDHACLRVGIKIIKQIREKCAHHTFARSF